MKWVLILVFYATDTITILDSERIDIITEELCREAIVIMKKDYEDEDINVIASCIEVDE